MAGKVIKGSEIATIDVVLVTVKPEVEDPNTVDELVLDTSNQIQTTIATETTEKVTLIIKGRLIAQKPEEVTVTGNTIVLTDNVFNPELVKILQGGVIEYEEDGKTFKKYTPPVSGDKAEKVPFTLKAYSAIYGADALIHGYECISYPHCQGVPIAFGSQDGVFRVQEYTINSAPATGEAPYVIERVKELPKVSVDAIPEDDMLDDEE